MINHIELIIKVFWLIVLAVASVTTCWEIVERMARRFRHRGIRGGIGKPPTAIRRRME